MIYNKYDVMKVMKILRRIRPKRKVVINSLTVALGATICIGIFNSYLINSRKENIRYRISSVADYQLKGVFDRYVGIADNWTALLVANNGQLDQEKFNEICEKLFAQYHDPAIRDMQLAPQGIIKYVYPLEGFESAINGNLMIGHRKEEAKLARDTGKATMGGPYELTQGGTACIIRDHLDKALQEREFEVYYQPVIRALTGELAGYEALVRWNSKELGFMPPYRFIPILEKSHQITKVDTYVIREICRQYREDVNAGRPVVPVSVNLSRVDLMQADMCDVIAKAAAAYHVPPKMLHVEITESMLVDNEEQMSRDIKRFHEAGFQVWMDDFGSGYSSLNTLKDFDFDVIKLDMKFLSSMSEKSKSILQSTVDMAKKIGIETLAEGCETQEQYDFLRDIGCEKIQGWYFGKTLPIEEARKNLAAKQIAAERIKI